MRAVSLTHFRRKAKVSRSPKPWENLKISFRSGLGTIENFWQIWDKITKKAMTFIIAISESDNRKLCKQSSNKGQLISKCLFGVFNFFQKTNEDKSTWGIKVVKPNSFIRVFGRIHGLTICFWVLLTFSIKPTTS